MEASDQHMKIIRKVSNFGRLALELLIQADECPHLAVRETTPPLALVSDSDICVAAQEDKAALLCDPLSAQRSISFLCHGCSPGLTASLAETNEGRTTRTQSESFNQSLSLMA